MGNNKTIKIFLKIKKAEALVLKKHNSGGNFFAGGNGPGRHPDQ
jgi:hypothetical protein